MNNDVLVFRNAIVGGTVNAHYVVAQAAERIQGWFRFMFLQSSLDESAVERGTSQTLEEALCLLRDELTPGGLRFRIFVTGKSRVLNPDFREQIYLIGQEALLNALRHSKASSVEVEIQYLPSRLGVVVRDNGCGINSELVGSGHNGRHCGLVGMRERAGSIGARLRIWSKPGCGTEVEISVPGNADISA
jgi:signal transduction histidine kinase